MHFLKYLIICWYIILCKKTSCICFIWTWNDIRIV